jgi:hypothetical protein
VDATDAIIYDACLCRGTDAFVRCSWEGQLWNDVGSPTETQGDLGIDGLSVAVGITR